VTWKAAVILFIVLMAAGPVFAGDASDVPGEISSKTSAGRPIAALSGIFNNSPRTVGIALILEGHLVNVLESTGELTLISTDVMKKELKNFNCLEEKCVLRFASNAGIDLFIMGEMDDRGDYIYLSLNAYGTGTTCGGKLFRRYEAEIPMSGGYTSKEYSYIFEEHAGFFVAGLMKSFTVPVRLHETKGAITAEERLTGDYIVYRKTDTTAGVPEIVRVGNIRLMNGGARNRGMNFTGGEYVLKGFIARGDFLEDFYTGRKKEIVFERPSLTTTVYKILFTVPASAVMPLLAPTFGYYRYGDWKGLALWTQSLPYIYLEYDGIFNSNPDDFRSGKRDITRDTKAKYYFGWYMLFAGGTSLFVDAFSNYYLNEASKYRTMDPVMGNSYSAAYLSFIAGGAGHFYRGSRFWGYFYFHLDNVLLYLTIREFSAPETYDPLTKKYHRGSVNTGRAAAFAGIFSAVKAVEIVHAVFTGDRIRNGKIHEEELVLEPGIYPDSETGMGFGLFARKRF